MGRGARPRAHCAMTLPCDISPGPQPPSPTSPGRGRGEGNEAQVCQPPPGHPGRKLPLSPGEACAFSMHLCWGVGEEACGVCRVRMLREMEETRGRSQPGPARGCWCSGGAGACPGSAAPPGRGAAGRQTVLVVPSPLPSEVTPSLSHSPPSLRGKPPLGGQSTYRSPTLGPPALLLKLLARGTHQNHSTQTSGPPSLSQACQGRSLSHWGALCLVHCVCPKRLPLTGLGSGRCPWW